MVVNSKILLVDDDKDLREMVANALRLRAYPVAAVADGKQALTRLQDEEFDEGITDVNLAGMSGIDLCAGVSGVRPDLPVIIGARAAARAGSAAEPEDLGGFVGSSIESSGRGVISFWGGLYKISGGCRMQRDLLGDAAVDRRGAMTFPPGTA